LSKLFIPDGPPDLIHAPVELGKREVSPVSRADLIVI